MIEHNYVAHEREGWSVCTRCGMVRNYDRPIAGCRGVIGNIAVRGGMTMTTVEEETETPVCSVCARPTGFAELSASDGERLVVSSMGALWFFIRNAPAR